MMKTVSRAEQAMFYASVNVRYLQDGIKLSTMEAEYVALSMAMIDLLPFKRLVKTNFMSIGFEKSQQVNIICDVFEDNSIIISKSATSASDTKIQTLCSEIPLA